MRKTLSDLPQKKGVTGTCSFKAMSPNLDALTSSTSVINLTLTFEEALKLNLAIDEGVRKLNAVNRSTKAGREIALKLIVYLDKKRLNVLPEA